MIPPSRGLAVLACVLIAAGCSDDGSASITDPATTTTSTTTDTTVTSTTAGTVSVSVEPLEITSSVWDNGRFELSDGSVSEDWGVAAAPAEGGPYPVAVVLHGNHATCPTDNGEGRTWPCPEGTESKHHEGLTYLVDALAERGFVAIAPGINVQYTLGAGEPMSGVRTAEIADRAIDLLEAGQLEIDPELVDVDQLVLVGHSQGGETSVQMAADRLDFQRPVAGLVMLQPSLNDLASLPMAEVPSVVIASECDGDTGVSVPGYYATESLRVERRAPVAQVVLEHANHNFTNTGLRPDAFPVATPGCADDRALDAEQQQALLAEIVPEFAHAVLADGRGASWAGAVFDNPVVPAGVQLGVVNAGQPVAAVPGAGPSMPAQLELDGMAATFCPLGYYTAFADPGTEACPRPELPLLVGLPQTIAVSWSEPGATLTVPIDAAPGDSIVLRLVPDVADPELNGDVIELRLATPEGDSVEASVAIPESVTEQVDPFTITHALLMWSTVTLDVPDGATAVTLEIESPSQGSIQIVSLGVEHR